MSNPAIGGYLVRIGNAQGWKCFHCSGPMLKTSARKDERTKQYDLGWTREHVVPRKLGGHNHGNIVLAHMKCNSSRGHQAPGPGMMQRAKAIWRTAR